ncbi:LysR family transcriptional regulator [Rouxiella sp. Mn2063]|uniref:LysR family transcriptional regulator n=1 Tax=Rouxiella sp. Mn2063 TaxID=3395262 RepID=UPI003BC5A522
MDMRHLRYFLALADELHFGRAANRLAISQPPLSVSIRQLEASLGVQLFERHSQGIKLTAAGEALVPAAQGMIERMQMIVKHIRDVERGVIGHLRIGFVGALVLQGLSTLVDRFQRQRAQLQLQLLERNTRDQLAELTHGNLDVGFVHSARLPDGISSLLFSSDPFVVCLPSQHHLAERARLSLHELQADNVIVFSRELSPDYYDHIQAVCFEAGIYPDVHYESRHWLSVVALVAQGLGVALVPASLGNAPLNGVKFAPLAGVIMTSQTYCVWREGDNRPLLSAFLDSVRQDIAARG